MATKPNTTPCRHCGSVACANGGGQMNGYYVIHTGCDESRAEKGLRPFEDWHATRKPEDDEAHDALDQDVP